MEVKQNIKVENLLDEVKIIPTKNILKRRKPRKKSRKERRDNHFLRAAEKRLRRKRREKGRKKFRQILTPLNRQYFEVIKAPANFSLINNTEEVLGFFKEAAALLSNRNQVDFDLRDIKDLTSDAIALLIAKIKDKNFTRGLSIKGNKPVKKELKRIFDESGFLEHVKSEYKPPKNEKNFLIHQVTNNKVSPDIAKKVGILSVKHSFKNDKKFQPIYKIMIECMANTDNHAGLNKQGVYDWWLFTYCDPVRNITTFTFLDLGVGIFNSNPVNSYKSNVLKGIDQVTGLNLTSRDNIKLIPKLFSGEIYTSRTAEKKRGQGLPSVQESSKNEHIKNFTIITNNVKIKLPSLESEVLSNKLNGTLLYWELHK